MKDLKEYMAVDEVWAGSHLLKIILRNVDAMIVIYIAKLIKNNIIKVDNYPVDAKAVQWVSDSTDSYDADGIKVDDPKTAISFAQLLDHLAEYWDKYAVLSCLIAKDKLKKIAAEIRNKAIKLAKNTKLLPDK